MTFNKLHDLIYSGRSAREILGDNPGLQFKRFSRMCHPDMFTDPAQKKIASDMFARLSAMYASLNGKVTTAPILVGKWVLDQNMAAVSGDLADVHFAEHPQHGPAVLKIVRDESDNDLMDREASALQALKSSTLAAKYMKYVPHLIEKFEASDRRVNALPVVAGVPLSQLPDLYEITDFRHIVWMFNRLLTALWVTHSTGLVHGAVTPDHLLYIPEDHGMVLIDWTASTDAADNPIPCKSNEYYGYYPPEVDNKRVYPGTDIYMAACCIRHLVDIVVDGKAPNGFQPILDWCTAGSIHSRPGSVQEVQERWKAAALKEFGKPKFIRMAMRATV